MEILLSPAETRVLAALVEKELTTPAYYPLTLNALLAACNQKSNRDPAMQVEEADALAAIDGLKEKRLAWQVAMADSRVPKYRHGLTGRFPFLTPPAVAVLCELMLRGPQTPAELRARASRMCELSDAAAVEAALTVLAQAEGGPMAVLLPREPGRRERRYAHLLSGEPAVPAAPPSAAADAGPGPVRLEDRLAALEERLARLEARLAPLLPPEAPEGPEAEAAPAPPVPPA